MGVDVRWLVCRSRSSAGTPSGPTTPSAAARRATRSSTAARTGSASSASSGGCGSWRRWTRMGTVSTDPHRTDPEQAIHDLRVALLDALQVERLMDWLSTNRTMLWLDRHLFWLDQHSPRWVRFGTREFWRAAGLLWAVILFAV